MTVRPRTNAAIDAARQAEHPFYEISRLPDLEPGEMTEWG
jgi:hypothetical protein